MQANILFVLSSQQDLNEPGTVTGAWLEEIATPYYMLQDAGCAVTLASIKGGEAPIDPLSLEDPWLTDMGRTFQSDDAARAALRNSLPLAEANPSDFDAIYFVGGLAAVWDFPADPNVARLLGAMGSDKIIAAICHGGCALANGPEGKPFAAGRRLTVISDGEDKLAGVDMIVPFLSESRLRELGGKVVLGDPFTPFVVEDGNLLTGQNPQSSADLARLILAKLERKALSATPAA